MRRVSSRQRLVSWDAFDATAGSDSEKANESSYASYADDSDEESYTLENESTKPHSLTSSIALDGLDEDASETKKGSKVWPRSRKRDRRSKPRGTEHLNVCKKIEIPNTVPVIAFETQGTQAIIPSYPWEIDKPSQSKMVQFDDLIDDLHLGIFSFLDFPSIRSVMSINHRYRELMLSDDAKVEVWTYHCKKIWQLEPKNHDGSPLNFVDNFSLPVAATTEKCYTNLSLLLSLTPAHFATAVDKVSLKPRTRLRRDIQQTIPSNRVHEEDQLIRSYSDTTTGRPTFQYTGQVGQGDRCIRGDHPLPRPTRLILNDSNYTSETPFFGSNWHNNRPSLFDVLRSSSKSMIRNSVGTVSSPTSPQLTEFSPFVVPFANQGIDGETTTVNITPRFVSYFEVDILNFKDDETTISQGNGVPMSRRYRTSYKDCVAVGVATRAFHFQSRMPGWDRDSYGYHGDDGGIFHCSGGMLKEFGPKFGPGDTVGCGIDYISKGIFYTLNGDFLGYAWENISDERLQRDFFPVVGVDTNSPIQVNFGSVAFQFDLSRFIKKHENMITSSYSLDGFSGTGCINVKATKTCNEVSKKKPVTRLPSPILRRKSLIGRRSQRER